MKKLILIALLGLSFGVKAQTIDTAYKAYPSAKIHSFLYNPRTDMSPVSRVQITGCVIDFTSKNMAVYYALCTADGTVIYNSTCNLTAVEYGNVLAGLQNGVAVIFQYLGTKLNIQYQ